MQFVQINQTATRSRKPFTFGTYPVFTKTKRCSHLSVVLIPAAKCSGVDFRPAVSLAFTVWGVINFLTSAASPVLQASNNSRSGSVGAGRESSAEPRSERRLDILFSRFTFSFDVPMSLINHIREFIQHKHVHTAGEACYFFDSS